MAKKKITPDAITAPPAVPAAPKRRAPAKKRTARAAPPIDIATVAATEPESPNGDREPSQAEIAEAAYFRHLKRGGAPGDEFRDWLEAERELKERHSR